jgi:hypothetical protein
MTPADKREFMRQHGIGVATSAGGAPEGPNNLPDNNLPTEHELEVARLYRDKGDIVWLRGANRAGPDAVVNGVNYDIKLVNGRTGTALRDAIRSAERNFSSPQARELGFRPSDTRAIIDVRGSVRWNDHAAIQRELVNLSRPGRTVMANVKEVQFVTSRGILRWGPGK